MTSDEMLDPILAYLIAERDHAEKMRGTTKSVQRTIWKARQEAFQAAIDYIERARAELKRREREELASARDARRHIKG